MENKYPETIKPLHYSMFLDPKKVEIYRKQAEEWEEKRIREIVRKSAGIPEGFASDEMYYLYNLLTSLR